MSPMVSAHARPLRGARAGFGDRPSRRAVLRGAGAVMLGGATLGLASCRGGSPAAVSGVDLAALAERYTRLALQFAKHQPSLVEVWLGPPAWAEGPRVPAPVLRARAAKLLADVELFMASDAWQERMEALYSETARAAVGVPTDLSRTSYLHGQVRALDEAAGRLLGEGHRFNDEALRTFGLVAPPRDASRFDAVRQLLSEALPGAGTLAERHGAFRRAAAVPPGRVATVFRAAVDWCSQASAAVLPLPQGATLTTRAEDTSGWAAFSRATGPRTSDLWVARSGGADAAHLLQLAAHEGTPGHHAQHVLATSELVDALGWTERLVHPAFGPHRLFAEGAAEAGADLLMPQEVREQVCREILMPAAAQSPERATTLVRVERLVAELDLEVAYVAADYLDTSLSMEAATNRLRDDALALDPAGMLSFIEKERSRVLAYPVGRRRVASQLLVAGHAERWARFRGVSTTLAEDVGLR